MTPDPEQSESSIARPQRAAIYPMAVIELGTSAIRLAIAETDGGAYVRILEQLTRGVSLGKDTFTRREIKRETLLQSIDVLKSYRQKLEEYQCTNPKHIRVVATSAVREASNRMTVLDRIYTSTGFVVEPIDEAEIARVTYLGIRPLLEKEPQLSEAMTLMMEVGGGSTEILLLRGSDILHSQSYRLGSLRIQQLVQQYHAAREQAIHLTHGQIDRTLEQLRDIVPQSGEITLLAIGGDMRFAAHLLQSENDSSNFSRIPLRKLAQLADRLAGQSTDQITREYHLEVSQAETLVPALLANVRMARMLNTDHVLVTNFNLRDALLQGMVAPAVWTEAFRQQIVHSAEELAKHLQVELSHSRHVALLACEIFDRLNTLHKLDRRCRTILEVAALLHECGLFISSSGYHKHSYYLIRHSKIFGLSSLDHEIVALVARYHRRASPKAAHSSFAELDRDSRVIVNQLASIMRLAIALCQSRSQRIRTIDTSLERNKLILFAKGRRGDLSMEQLELRQNSALFEDIFGISVLLRKET